MLKGKMEFRLGSEHRVRGRGDIVVIPGGAEHEAWSTRMSSISSHLRATTSSSAADPPT